MHPHRRRFLAGFTAFALGGTLRLVAAPARSAGQPAASMPEPRFWTIVDASRGPEQEAQTEALFVALSKLPPDELVAFERTLDSLMRRSYRWDLWGAAYVAMGGASDDDFEYFRLWLIARGHAVFETVLANPDALVDLVPADPADMAYEAFAHIAPDIWSDRTGKSWDDMPGLPVFFSPTGYGEPAGKPLGEDPRALAKLYPRLWAKFGGARP